MNRLAITCFLLAVPGCLLLAQPSPVSDLSLGMALESGGQVESARTIYASILRSAPLNAEAYRRYKALELRTSNFDRLVQFTDSLLDKNPGNIDLVLGEAEGLAHLGRKSQAVGILNGLTRTEPEYARQVGAVYEATGMNQEAIQTYLDYRRRKNTPGIFAPNLTALYEKVGDYAGATREAVSMLNINPRLVKEYTEKFQFYARKSSATQVLAELARVKDEAAKADLRARVLLAAGQLKDALDEVAAMNSVLKTLEFAQFCEQSGYFNAAAELYGRLGRQYDQARILRKQGKVHEAATILGASNDPNAMFELAELQRIELHDYAAAAASYDRVIQAMPAREAAYAARAECLLRLGRLDGARLTLKSAPWRTPEVVFGLAQIAFFQDSLDSCQANVQELLRASPESPLVNDALELALLTARGGDGLKGFAQARFDFLQGSLDRAIEESKTLVRTDSVWADQAYLLLADCFRARKEPNDALSALADLEQNRPQSPFRAKARYEKALVYLEDLKNDPEYQRQMESVYNDFPASPYAALARNRLVPSSQPHD